MIALFCKDIYIYKAYLVYWKESDNDILMRFSPKPMHILHAKPLDNLKPKSQSISVLNSVSPDQAIKGVLISLPLSLYTDNYVLHPAFPFDSGNPP